jgi:hypothetical protein
VPAVVAQSPKQSTPQAFLSADERMEPVVRDILTTIKRIDSRLERIEKSLASIDRDDFPAAPAPRGRSR